MILLEDLINKKQKSILEKIQDELNEIFPVHYIVDPFTPHGPSHAKKVQYFLNLLMNEEHKKLLTSTEIFCLLSAALLHDIGMALHPKVLLNSNDPYIKKLAQAHGIYDRDFPIKIPEEIRAKIRAQHSNLSMAYVRKNASSLGIKDCFSQYIISLMCEIHTKDWDLIKYDNSLIELEKSSKLLSLSALLRLADILHSDYTRIQHSRLHIEFLAELPLESWIHWAKHLLLQHVSPRPNDGVIDLLFVYPYKSKKAEKFLFRDLSKKVCEYIQQEIDRTREILLKSKLPTYFKVEMGNIENTELRGPLSVEEERRVCFFINQYRISRQISATGVRESVLLSIEEVALNTEWSIMRFEDVVVNPIKKLFKYAYDSFHGNRQIENLGNDTISLLEKLKKESENNINTDNEQEIIKNFKEQIKKLLDRNKHKFKSVILEVKENALISLRKHISEKDCLLLFSVSTTVAVCLSALLKEVNISPKIVVSEARNKCISPFSDSISYVNKLIENGIEVKNIRLISDASIGYYMAEGNDYRITKVLLGMGEGWIDEENGIYFILNTVGSRIITKLAKSFKQMVIVFGETSKFSTEKILLPRSKMVTDYQINQFAPDVILLTKELNIKSINEITLDPVQDVIPSSEIDLMITNSGSYSSNDIRQFFSDMKDH